MKVSTETIIKWLLDNPGAYDREIRESLGISWFRPYEPSIEAAGYYVTRTPDGQRMRITLTPISQMKTLPPPPPAIPKPDSTTPVEQHFEILTTSNGVILNCHTKDLPFVFNSDNNLSARASAFATLATLLDDAAPEARAIMINVMITPVSSVNLHIK